jgi:membrane-associated phospholipid phosphatase
MTPKLRTEAVALPRPSGHVRRTRHTALCAAAWLGAIVIAGTLDAPVARAVRASAIDQFLHHSYLLECVLKAPGEWWFALIVAAAVAWMHASGWRSAAFVLVVTLLSGVNGLLKWVVGRTRPFKLLDAEGLERLAPFDLNPFRGGIEGTIQQTNLCFPSGHTAWAFATAASLAILWPRWRRWFYGCATVVAAERVAENAHWLSDTVAAAALGVGAAHLVRWLWWDAQRCREGQQRERERRAPGLPLAGDSCIQ